MFSDVLSDSYYEILESIDPEYSYEEIYIPNEVIKMLAHIRYVTLLSDAMNSDGSYNYSKKKLREIALYHATKDYYRHMKQNYAKHMNDTTDPKFTPDTGFKKNKKIKK